MVAVTANLKIGITEVNKDSLRMFTLGEKKKKSVYAWKYRKKHLPCLHSLKLFLHLLR